MIPITYLTTEISRQRTITSQRSIEAIFATPPVAFRSSRFRELARLYTEFASSGCCGAMIVSITSNSRHGGRHGTLPGGRNASLPIEAPSPQGSFRWYRGGGPESLRESARLNLPKSRPRLTRLPAPRKLFWTFSRQGKWGSAVQFARGPATVFGFIAESQATLPRRRGCAYFARGYASSTTPASRRVFYLQISYGTFVRGDSCTTVLPMPCVAPAFSAPPCSC